MKRWTLLLMVLVMGLTACNTTTDNSDPLEGSYSATLFRITPSGESEVDVLANGGRLTMTISETNTTTGSLIVPSSVDGGITASMTGTAVLSGSTVTFQQTVDTFVSDLTWTRTPSGLTVSNQLLDGSLYTITLSRQ